jgi:hypothetical protein
VSPNSLRRNLDNQPVLIDILTRLHARACQITHEILCLMSAGLADGAMARWRTLHEIAVISFLLKEHGEELAIRYRLYEIVESYKASRDYNARCDQLGYEPLDEFELLEIKQQYDRVIQEYGSSFGKQYGWASDVLGSEHPSFAALERKVGIDHLRGHYGMASYNVHANPKGIFFNLGLMDENALLLAGPSNSGLADPGHAAAISLLQVSTVIGTIEPNLDRLVVLRILQKISDEIGHELQATQNKLDEHQPKVDRIGCGDGVQVTLLR